ncbi:hypothetical protein GCM10027159_14180 [Lysobacter terrae]
MVLFPNDPTRRAYLYYSNCWEPLVYLRTIRVIDPGSRWRMDNGTAIGAALANEVRRNGRPIDPRFGFIRGAVARGWKEDDAGKVSELWVIFSDPDDCAGTLPRGSEGVFGMGLARVFTPEPNSDSFRQDFEAQVYLRPRQLRNEEGEWRLDCQNQNHCEIHRHDD